MMAADASGIWSLNHMKKGASLPANKDTIPGKVQRKMVMEKAISTFRWPVVTLVFP